MGVHRAAEAAAVAGQIPGETRAGSTVGDLLAERRQPLPQRLVNVDQLLAETGHTDIVTATPLHGHA